MIDQDGFGLTWELSSRTRPALFYGRGDAERMHGNFPKVA